MDTKLDRLSDEQYTPAWIFEKMGVQFDLDVSAPKGGIAWIPAKSYFTKEDDGLKQEWSGNVWMNPPFSKVTPWVEKFIENRQGICLLVVSRSYWFQKLWESADGILNTVPNLKFERPMDMKPNSISFQTFMFAYGKENVEALNKLGGRVR